MTKIIQAWKSRQAESFSVSLTWKQPADEVSGVRNYQAEWPPQDDKQQEEMESTIQLCGEFIKYRSFRWYALQTMEFAGFTEPARPYYRESDYFHALYFNDTPAQSFNRAWRQGFSKTIQQKREPRRFTMFRDHEKRIDFFEPCGGLYAQAILHGTPPIRDRIDEAVDSLPFLPVILTYRPLWSGAGAVEEAQCQITSANSYVNGRTTVVVEESGRHDALHRYWVDMERDCTVIRYIAEQRGKPRIQADISYQQDRTYGWVPRKWQLMLFPESVNFLGYDRIVHNLAASVVKYEIQTNPTNIELKAPDFPAGSLVIDNPRQEAYISLSDGTKRVISQSEMQDPHVSYERVLGWRALWLLRGFGRFSLTEKLLRVAPIGLVILVAVAAIGWAYRRYVYCRHTVTLGRSRTAVIEHPVSEREVCHASALSNVGSNQVFPSLGHRPSGRRGFLIVIVLLMLDCTIATILYSDTVTYYVTSCWAVINPQMAFLLIAFATYLCAIGFAKRKHNI